jgi:ferredoxin
MYEVIVGTEKCTGCGECVDVCTEEVFELQDEKSVPVNVEECVGRDGLGSGKLVCGKLGISGGIMHGDSD